MGMRIPPLRMKIMLESNPLKSIIVVQRLAIDLMGRFDVVARRCAAVSGRLDERQVVALSLREEQQNDCLYIYIYI